MPDGWCFACGRYRGDRTLEQLAKVAATGGNLTAEGFDECFASFLGELLEARDRAEKSEEHCICGPLGSLVVEGIIDSACFDDELDPYPNNLRDDLELIWWREKDVARAILRVLDESPSVIATSVEATFLTLKRRRP